MREGKERMKRLGFIGFGEVGSTLAEAFLPGDIEMAAFDIQADRAKPLAAKRGVGFMGSMDALIEWADLVFSCNSPAMALDVAKICSRKMGPEKILVDFNSISPKTTQGIDQLFSSKGPRFVKAAIMTPIASYGYRTPILIGGAGEETILRFMKERKFQVRSLGRDAQKPATVKMVKSLLGKGFSTLLFETCSFAKKVGVEEEVDVFLHEMFGARFWEMGDRYLASVSVHAPRMIGEMDELIEEMADRKVPPDFPLAMKSVLQRIADMNLAEKHGVRTTSVHQEILRLLNPDG
jgi:3-hydroxyisobutyrate dehydrogenase-like beta-hydroxyacid dehydrogenase